MFDSRNAKYFPIKGAVTHMFSYLFGIWLNVCVLLGIVIYLFLVLPPEAYADSRAGATFYDNAFGVLLHFFSQGTAYWRLVGLVGMPLMAVFLLCSLALWLWRGQAKEAARKGYYGLIVSLLALFLLLMTSLVAAVTDYKVKDYRTPIIEEYWKVKRAF